MIDLSLDAFERELSNHSVDDYQGVRLAPLA